MPTATFLADFEPFAARVAAAGERVALGQLVLKLTAPGVPDIYQGDELPFRALVDPDNRRPVDWEWRQAMLGAADGRRAARPRDAQAVAESRALLGLRARRPEPFARRLRAARRRRGTRAPSCAAATCWSPSPSGPARPGVCSRRQRPLARRPARRGAVLCGREPLARLLGEHGLAVFERV